MKDLGREGEERPIRGPDPSAAPQDDKAAAAHELLRICVNRQYRRARPLEFGCRAGIIVSQGTPPKGAGRSPSMVLRLPVETL